ncbi:TonB-dependent receptor domain-containing protein [Psychrobacter sp. FDAARGOS_221]|uniref:TonB-dependent receptor domain-containing protein n=1 Tax=Psychrobacter sp. FDAARGOS_221 TaxID=1975705 RepID=UPI000BB54D9F|nr:TonB-dependent receptor [Psychrobacter sp. FDAARGOS_221]PNK60005.1 TonB-dependent receptor [Psychrobacter sp. FDAARGOS_221]
MNTCFSPLYKSLFLVNHNYRQLSLATSTAFIASLACAPALAANGDAINLDANSPHITLPTTTITATRSPTAINNTIAQTRVIKSEDLKHFQGQTALDVIKRQPGFNFKQTGGMGTSSNFYVRGYDNKQILVLIDGVPFRSLSTGEPALNLISSDQIDRIEILYGASGTSIYGADAMGGVIQVFTKGYNGDHSQFSVTAGAGSHDHYQYGASAQFNSDSGTRLSLSANRNETKGYNATFIDHPWGIYNPDDDGFESNNYSLRLDQKINDDINVGISGLYSDSETEFDNGLTNGKDNTLAKQKNGAAQAYANWRYMPGSNLKLAYGHSIDKSDNPTYSSYYNTKQDQISLVGQHALPVGTAIYGAEHLKQKLDSNQYQTDDRKVTSGFLGYLVSYDNIDAQANVRYDDYSDFDDKTTYNLGAAYRFTPDFRIGANYAKGYRVPTFGDLYAWGGDPNLKPETSDNYEAFVDYTTVNQTTRLTGYINKLDDMIAGDENYQRKNYTKAKIEGVTFTTDWNIDDYLFGLSYDYQEAKDDGDKQDKGNYLPNRPKHKGLIYAGYQLADLDLRAEYEYVGHYYYDGTNNDKADNYGLFNISGNYQLSPNLSLSARLNNVFNKKYVTSPGYSTDDGTNFFTSLTYTWK